MLRGKNAEFRVVEMHIKTEMKGVYWLISFLLSLELSLIWFLALFSSQKISYSTRRIEFLDICMEH